MLLLLIISIAWLHVQYTKRHGELLKCQDERQSGGRKKYRRIEPKPFFTENLQAEGTNWKSWPGSEKLVHSWS